MDDKQYQIDLLRAINSKIADKERMYRLLVEQSDHAYLYNSIGSDKVYMLGSFSDMFDFQIKDVRDFCVLIDHMKDSYSENLYITLYPEREFETYRSIEVCDYNEKNWYRFECSISRAEDGNIAKIIKITDITKDHSKNSELQYMAYYDSLTGIYNRNYFVSLLNDFILTAADKDDTVSIITIDIDDFKRVNDGMGMIVGDECLQQFGSFLKTLQDDRVIVSHLSNDIFCVGIYNPIGEYSVERIYKKIKDRLRFPFRMSTGQDVSLTVSLSIASYPESALSAFDLINCADIVMLKCKASGKDQIKYFDASMFSEFMEDVELENKLKEAVFNNNFVVYFQPQFVSKTKELRGMEALVRWKNDDGSLISPGVFIPLAEKNGTIIPIGKFVLDESIRRYAQWKAAFNIDFTMSINISALQYKKDDFTDTVLSTIEKYGVDPQNIELEITESLLIEDFEDMIEKIKFLRSKGVKFSLDDFGTGYSSLSYLKRFPIDTLKIDKSFVDTILSDDSTRIITDSILSMSHNMGFESIAEGVENAEQYDYLNSAGCDVIQGFFFGKPSSAEEISNLLEDISSAI